MPIGRAPATCERETRRIRKFGLLLGTLTLLGVVGALSHPSGGPGLVHGAPVIGVAVQNDSNESDPAGSGSAIVCPSSGPIIVGVQWNCIAVLNLTELLLIVIGIGIIAYVFKDAARAELPVNRPRCRSRRRSGRPTERTGSAEFRSVPRNPMTGTKTVDRVSASAAWKRRLFPVSGCVPPVLPSSR